MTATDPTMTPTLVRNDAPSPQPLTDLQVAAKAMRALTEDLRDSFVQRDVEALLLCVALIAEEHLLLLGKPGTAKTKIVTAFVGRLGIAPAQLYKYLLGKTTQPDELFGAMDMVAYKKGIVRTVTTGKLPEATVAVLDEIFKGNSAILNSMLTIINEREYHNPTPVAVPLQLVVGMSNELPEGGAHGYLGALYDRFLFRRWVDGIDVGTEDAPNADGVAGLRGLLVGGGVRPLMASVTQAQVATLRAARHMVDLEPVVDAVMRIKMALEQQGLEISDRRLIKAMTAVRAHAVLHGRSTATLADIAILAHCLWDEPEQARMVQAIVMSEADKALALAMEQRDIALEAMATVPGPGKMETLAEYGAWSTLAITANGAIKEARRVVQGLGSDSAQVVAVDAELHRFMAQIDADSNRRLMG